MPRAELRRYTVIVVSVSQSVSQSVFYKYFSSAHWKLSAEIATQADIDSTKKIGFKASFASYGVICLPWLPWLNFTFITAKELWQSLQLYLLCKFLLGFILFDQSLELCMPATNISPKAPFIFPSFKIQGMNLNSPPTLNHSLKFIIIGDARPFITP